VFRPGRRYAAAALAAAALGLWTVPAGAANLAAYRAVYDISLDPAVDSSDIAELSGRVVAEFRGSPCKGYNAAMRFVLAMENPDGDKQVTDSRTTSFEDSGGNALDFANQTYVDEKLTEDSRGRAKRTGKGVAVALTKPASKQLDLASSVIFPTQQVEQILAAARAGESFLAAKIYDGSDDGQKVFSTAVVIGRELTDDIAADEPAASRVKSLRHWPVTVSYFEGTEPGEQAPSYVMSFVLFENGVQTRLKINYGGFGVVARLNALDILPVEACP
jgi:hypothetical protein